LIESIALMPVSFSPASTIPNPDLSKPVSGLASVADNGVMNVSDGFDKPKRRVITPAQKLQYLAEYEQAVKTQEGAAFLRAHGLYSSQMTQWRKQRDAGILEGKNPGDMIGKPSKDQAEIARLKRQLAERDQELETTQTALEIMGKAHALLESVSKRAESHDTKRNNC